MSLHRCVYAMQTGQYSRNKNKNSENAEKVTNASSLPSFLRKKAGKVG